MSQDVEKYRRWIREGASGRSAIIYYLGKALIQELGEEKGTAVIIKQIEEMGHNTGMGIQKSYNSRGLDNSLENFFT